MQPHHAAAASHRRQCLVHRRSEEGWLDGLGLLQDLRARNRPSGRDGPYGGVVTTSKGERDGGQSSGNALVIAFADDGRPIPVLIRSDGAVIVMHDGPAFRALSLDGISFPAG